MIVRSRKTVYGPFDDETDAYVVHESEPGILDDELVEPFQQVGLMAIELGRIVLCKQGDFGQDCRVREFVR